MNEITIMTSKVAQELRVAAVQGFMSQANIPLDNQYVKVKYKFLLPWQQRLVANHRFNFNSHQVVAWCKFRYYYLMLWMLGLLYCYARYPFELHDLECKRRYGHFGAHQAYSK